MPHIATDQFTYQSTAVSSRTFTLTQSFPAGTTIVGGLVTTSAGSQITMSSVTDSNSNTWTVSGSGSTVEPETFNASTVQIHLFSGRVTTSLAAGDTVTITLGATASRWAVSLEGFDDVISGTRFDQKATNTGTSASMSSGTTGTTTQAAELVVAGFAYGSSHSANVPSGWSGSAQVATTGGSNDRELQMIWKYVTATGAQSVTATLDSSSVYAAAIATYKQVVFSSSTFTPGSATTSDAAQATAWTLTLKPAGTVSGGGAPPPSTGNAYIGVSLTSQGTLPGESTTTMADFETKSLRPMAILREFKQHITDSWFATSSSEYQIANQGAGHGVVLSTKLYPYTWAQVANKAADSALAARVADAVRFGQPFWVAFHHEPKSDINNNAGSGYTMTDYVNMQRYCVNYFRSAGATNVSFMLIWDGSPDNKTFPGDSSSSTPEQYFSATYPGDAYMDWIGFDPYSASPQNSSTGTGSPYFGLNTRFETWLNRFYNWATTNAPTKPIALCEVGIAEVKSDDGSIKAATYPKLLNWLKYATRVQMVLLFNGTGGVYADSTVSPIIGGNIWYIDSPAYTTGISGNGGHDPNGKALKAWQTFCNDPYFFPSGGITPPPSNNQTGTLNVTATATPAFSGGTTSKAGTLSVSASASPFFVGSGTGGGATSSSSLTWPGVTVSAQFAGVWTDITSKVALLPDTTLISLDAGRTFELDTVEATTVSFALDNRDGRFDPTNTSSPYWPNVVALCPIRIQTTWLGRTYSLFTGYVERWPQSWEQTGLLGVSSPVATDALALLAVQKLLAPWVGQAKASGADYIYPLTEAAGATTVTDLLGNGPAGTLVRKNGGTVTLGGDPPIAGLGNASFTPDAYIRFTPPLINGPAFSAEVIFYMPDPGNVDEVAFLIYQGDPGDPTRHNGLAFWLFADSSSGTISVSLPVAGGSANQYNTPSSAFNLDTWTHLTVTVTSAGVPSMYVDGVAVSLSPFGVGGTYAGGAFASDVTLLGKQAQAGVAPGMTVSLAGVAFYDGVTLTSSQVPVLHQAYLGLAGQRTDERATSILAQAGWTGGTSFDVGSGTMGSADFDGRTVLDLLQETALVEGTDIHVDGSGALVMRGRSSLQHPASTFTFGENAGEVHYEDIEFDYDPTYLYTQVVVSRPDGGTVTQTVPNSPYGLRTYELSLNVGSDSEALSAAQHYLALYQQPHLRVARLTFNPSALKDFTAAFTLQLGDAVTVNRRAPGASPISGTFMVQHISHDVASGVWRTTLSLSPVDTASYLVLNDATFGQLDQEVLGW